MAYTSSHYNGLIDILYPGQKYVPPTKLQSHPDAMDTAEDELEDRGWKVNEESKRRKGKGRADATENAAAGPSRAVRNDS